MAPNTIILGNNESHTIALGSFIRLKAWIMPDDLSGIKLEVSGDVSYNRSNDAQLYVTDCRGRVEIIVKPASGGSKPEDVFCAVQALNAAQTGRKPRKARRLSPLRGMTLAAAHGVHNHAA